MPQLTLADEAMLDVLQPLRAALETPGQRGKTALVKNAAQRLGKSPATVWKQLEMLGYDSGRRRRSDAGKSCVTDAEVRAVATIVISAYRENNKRLMSIKNAMEHAWANDLLHAECSETTMARRMRELNMHPIQYERPPAHRNLKSNHPNHVWQVDPSLCVLYRMPSGKYGVTRLDDELIYKNKLENLKELEKRPKLWRYVQWDHYSSAFFFRYYETPGESSQVLLEFLIEAATVKADQLHMPMYGWPNILLWDKGSANRSAPVKNMLGHLAVRHQTHKAKNARVKGGVENCNNLIETNFESQLAFVDIPSVEELNRRADAWQMDYNSLNICNRHGKTRYSMWMSIKQHELRVCSDTETLRLLANHDPEQRKVNGDLTVSYLGRRYDVQQIPTVSAGDAIFVALNAYSRDSVWAMVLDEKGIERHIACPEIARDEAGFLANAVPIGEDYRALEDRPVDVARKDLREDAWGSRDENEAADARRKGRVAMDGRVDPFRAVEQRKAQLPGHLSRHTTQIHKPNVSQVEVKPMDHIAMLRELKARLGRGLEQRETAAALEWFKEGIEPNQIDGLVERIQQLSAVGAPPAFNEAPRLVAVKSA